jgi:hypothetical protein
MIRYRYPYEDGLTGLEMVILLTVFISVSAVLLVYQAGGSVPGGVRTFPGGFVAESIYVSGNNLHVVGNVYGFPSLSRTSGTTSIVIRHEDPGRLGVVRLVVSLFIGDSGAIDMNRIAVQWNRDPGQEILSRTTSATLVCPNWTISNKYTMLPGSSVDSDNLLEPGEQFEITLCPSDGVPPYQTLTIVFSPDGVVMPLTIARTVPFSIQPVMNLG